ncbi:MAG: ribulokinase [Planctomycetota bacterium]
MLPIALGLDFGTESARAILIDANGKELAVGTDAYAHGQIVETLPDSTTKLPANYALQHPTDWIDSAAKATRDALQESGLDGSEIVGIGVDFTSCTMLPTTASGTPLCLDDQWRGTPLAWPKLWKHHGAIEQTDRMNRIAHERGESFLNRYGGTIGLEWFFPKLLETIDGAPEVAEAADVWLEAGDWFVWQLVGGDRQTLPRSTCQAGYKALWSATDGFASQDYLNAVDPGLAEAADQKMPGRILSPGERAGELCDVMADRLGLPAGIAVSAATIDAHSAVPGVGAAEPGTLVMVLGTSSCHMLNSTTGAAVDGVAGIVEGGILPGLFGYETGQAAVGDAFAWLLNLLNLDSFDQLGADAMRLPPGAEGVCCLDWMNGCRTPLMDGALKGAFSGLSLQSKPAHLYRALLESSAYGLRWIVDVLRDGGVPVEAFVATGGLPHHNPDVVQIYADVLNTDIEVHPSQQGPAVGAAVLGMVAAGCETTGFETVAQAAKAMAAVEDANKRVVQPRPGIAPEYDKLYADYRTLARTMMEMQR